MANEKHNNSQQYFHTCITGCQQAVLCQTGFDRPPPSHTRVKYSNKVFVLHYCTLTVLPTTGSKIVQDLNY